MTVKRVVVTTGNVISTDILKRPARTAADELWEGVKSAMTSGDRSMKGDEIVVTGAEQVYDGEVNVDDLLTTVKIFVNSASEELLHQAVSECRRNLKTNQISTIILAYHPRTGPHVGEVTALRSLWSALQSYVDDGTVELIGLADVDVDTFVELYQWARVKPAIVQLSLAGCCIVPPPLQEFARNHEIQLLTHSDPPGK